MFDRGKPVKFDQVKYYSNRVVRCSRCFSIWTPGSVVMGYRVPGYTPTAPEGFRPVRELPENECPGCGATEGGDA